MIDFLFFGKFEESPTLNFLNYKLKNESMDEKLQISPDSIFNISKSLYQMGEELQGGSLKELDLKNFYLIIHKSGDLLLVIGIREDKKREAMIKDVKANLNNLFQICDYIYSNSLWTSNIYSLLSMDEKAKKFSFNSNIKKQLKQLERQF